MRATIRPFTAADIDFALTHINREGWDAIAEHVRVWLAHDPEGGFIAEVAARPVGLVTTTRYARTAWIGNLIVEPAHRLRGIGRLLMTKAMSHLSASGVQTIRLEADPPGVPLYRQLGFVEELESPRFRRPAHTTKPHSAQTRGGLLAGLKAGHPHQAGHVGDTCCSVEPLRSDDLTAVAAFDLERFGDDRSRMLTLWHRIATAGYCARDRAGLAGYALVLPSQTCLRLAPWVASSPTTAELLLRRILDDWGERELLVGVPSPNPAATELLLRHGFVRVSSCLRMRHGQLAASGHPEQIWAIGGGATG